MRYAACYLFALTTLAATVAVAQTPESFDDLSGKIKSGDVVRIAEASGAISTGRISQISRDSVTLDTAAGEHTVPFGDVGWLAARHRSPVRGLIIGTAIGVGVGAFSDECRGEQENTFGPQSTCTEAVAMYGLLGTGIGAMVGALIPHSTMLYRSHKIEVSGTDWQNKALGVRVRW